MEDQSRIDRAKEYFQQPENQSPTSLILGLHGQLTDSVSAIVKFDEDTVDAGASRPCILTVTYEPPSVNEARDIVTTQLGKRIQEVSPTNGVEALPAEDPESSQVEDTPTEFEAEDELAGTSLDDAAEDEELEDDGELEMGQSELSALLQRMGDDAWLAEPGNAAAVIDLAKPATVIDGQHRLLGADATERPIPFSVVALVDCPWEEQVFQFTVVNYTAKGIPDQFITANAAMSLTKPELDYLKTRLVQANVKIKEYDLMRVVNFDSRSPFLGLINLSEGKDKNRIGYKTMVQVANQWFDARHQVFNTLLPRLYPDVKGKGQKARRIQRWREGDWGEFFLAFWQQVHQTFATEPSHEAGKNLWDVGHSQLTVAVVLLEFQRAFLDNLNAQDEDFFDVEVGDPLPVLTQKVSSRAKKFVNFFPSQFFATKWGISSLNTGSGRQDLESCIRSMVDAKGKYQYLSDRLIVGVK